MLFNLDAIVRKRNKRVEMDSVTLLTVNRIFENGNRGNIIGIHHDRIVIDCSKVPRSIK